MFRIAWHPCYSHPLPRNHRFPMVKYDLIREQLLHEGIAGESSFFDPPKFEVDDILAVHQWEYLSKLRNGTLSRNEERATGFPWSKSLIDREEKIAFGTIQCAIYALRDGISLNIAGGTHHAFSDKGEGFCLLNDQAMAASYLIRKRMADRVLIVDLDVHQGNGTAEIFQNDPNVVTLSVHGARNYPLRKEQSDYDLSLDDHISDNDYLQRVSDLLVLVNKEVKPSFVFYQAGVDVIYSDKLGRLGLTTQGCYERDLLVFDLFRSFSIPVVACMGGGYSASLATIVNAHTNTFRAALHHL